MPKKTDVRFIYEIKEVKQFQGMKGFPSYTMFYFPNPEIAEEFIDSFSNFLTMFSGSMPAAKSKWLSARLNRIIKDYALKLKVNAITSHAIKQETT
jgi:hypothetical protein